MKKFALGLLGWILIAAGVFLAGLAGAVVLWLFLHGFQLIPL